MILGYQWDTLNRGNPSGERGYHEDATSLLGVLADGRGRPGGRRCCSVHEVRRPKFEIRFGWLVLMALAAQLAVIYADFGDAAVLRRFIFPSTYVLLLAFVALNRRRLGFLVIGVGMLLNFLAIVS